jgi:hypothetical protein
MQLTELPVVDPRAAITADRADLITVLLGLSDHQWIAPTEAGHWRVKDVALHVLDDELGWLSRSRDRDASGLLATDVGYRDFVRSLDAKNERWVVGAAQLSRRVVADLLRWAGDEVDEYLGSLDLVAESWVIWASDTPVPVWFDLCRDLTERWVHQQHVRDAVHEPGDHHRRLPDVLRTFVWAFPHQYDAPAPAGTTVQVALGEAGTWHLIRDGGGWTLEEGAVERPAASLSLRAPDAWRQLTGLHVPADRICTTGTDDLVRPLLAVRGIIA